MANMTPTFEDVLGCLEAAHEWAESYDTKDWDRLSRCIAPHLHVDYRSVMGKMWEAMPARDFINLASNPHFLGNKRIKTQHLVGAATKWVKVSDTEMIGYHQMRVAHQKYSDDELTTPIMQGHAYGKATINYTKVDLVWKFAGLEPDIRWGEADHDKIFGP